MRWKWTGGLLLIVVMGIYGYPHMTGGKRILSGTAAARNDGSGARSDFQPDLILGLGDSSDEIMRTAKVPIRKSHVSTALMYDASRISTGVEPVFAFRDPRHGIVFPRATDVEFMSDTQEGGKTRNIRLSLKGPTPPENVSDDAALKRYDRAMYEFVMHVIALVNGAGWKRYIDPASPRIKGRATYAFESGYSGSPAYGPFPLLFYADPNYPLSWDEWQHLPRHTSIIWNWYAGGMFLDLTYSRERRSPDVPVGFPDQLDATIKSEAAWLDTYGASYDAAREKYRSEIPGLVRRRMAGEEKARRLGVPVLTNWTDPSIAGVVVPKN